MAPCRVRGTLPAPDFSAPSRFHGCYNVTMQLDAFRVRTVQHGISPMKIHTPTPTFPSALMNEIELDVQNKFL